MGVAANLICQSGPSPGIKTHFSPAAFPTTLSLSFSPHSSPSCTVPPGCVSGRAELHLLPAGAPSPQNRYGAASGKNAAARHAGSYSLDASAALSPRPSDPCVTPWTVALVKRPAFQQVAGDGLRCRTPAPPPLQASSTNPSHLLTSPLRRPVADLHRGFV